MLCSSSLVLLIKTRQVLKNRVLINIHVVVCNLNVVDSMVEHLHVVVHLVVAARM